jgi:hypothetical protein
MENSEKSGKIVKSPRSKLSENIDIFNHYIDSLSQAPRKPQSVKQPNIRIQCRPPLTLHSDYFDNDQLNTASCIELREQIEQAFPKSNAHSAGLRNASIRVNHAIESFKKRSGRLPAEPEAAALLGMNTTTYQNLLLFLLRAKTIVLKESDDFMVTLFSLPQYQVKILSLLYLKKSPEWQIAERLQTSPQRISISHASSLHYLAQPLTKPSL